MIWSLIVATMLPWLFLFQADNSLQTISSVAGFMGATLLFWMLVLGFRPIAQWLSDDILGLNKIHGELGKYGVLFLLIHPLATMLNYGENFWWLITPSVSSEFQLHVNFGRVALLLFLIIWVTSAVVRGNIKYRPWLYVHYLSYPLMLLTLLHAREIGTSVNNYPVLDALWTAMIPTYSVFLLLRIAWAFGLGKTAFQVTSIVPVTSTIIELNIIPLNRQKLFPKIAQYVYLQLRRGGESHPFSVVNYNHSSGEMTFLIKKQGPFTQNLGQLQAGQKIYVDGPYGNFAQQAWNDKPKVIIAGGVGLGLFVRLIKTHPQNTVLLHCNRHTVDVYRRDELIHVLGPNYHEFLSKESVHNSLQTQLERLNVMNIVNILGKDQLLHYDYYICGSPQFNTAIIAMLSQLQIPQHSIHQEKFSS